MEHTQQTAQTQTMVIVPQHEWQRQTELMQKISTKFDNLDLLNAAIPKEYISVKETCKRFSISRNTFEVMKREGTIKVYKIKGKVFTKLSEMRELFENSQL